jgi:hypothetical protein
MTVDTVRRLMCLAALLAPAALPAQERARPSEVLYLHGDALVQHRVFTPSDLAGQPPDSIGAFVQSRGTPGSESRSTVRGVRLAKLVEGAGLTAAAQADWKNLVVTVTATDGYRAQFTWVELTNTSAGTAVLVLFERDGAPLDAREGRIAVLAGGDLRLGARHVRNALRVEVRPLPQ